GAKQTRNSSCLTFTFWHIPLDFVGVSSIAVVTESQPTSPAAASMPRGIGAPGGESRDGRGSTMENHPMKASSHPDPRLSPAAGSGSTSKPARRRRMAREPQTEPSPSANAVVGPNGQKSGARQVPAQTKIAAVIALLQRSEGATLDEMIEATGWLPHTTRAALTGLKKKSHTISKSKRDDVTCYFISRPAS
ncbi:MAG TPA: DUF3489 domain-containing protein, partial [Croceibacterium sp.]